jgi:hypothetical protein
VKIFLDDERSPQQVTWIDMPLGPWVVVRNYDEFVDYITKNGIPSFVSFDHDLADEHYRPEMYNPDKKLYMSFYTDGTFKEKTGLACAQWLVEKCLNENITFPDYQVHSMNPIGRENIAGYIESFKRIIQQ